MTKKNKISQPFWSRFTVNQAVNKVVDDEGKPTPAFQKAILSSLTVQRPLVLANLRRLRRKNPDASPAELADMLSKVYLHSLTSTGAAAGGTAVLPGIGTTAALGTSFAAALGFLQITSLYAQSLAELYGLETHNDQEAQALVMALMLGEDGRKILSQAAASSDTTMGTLAPASMIITGISGISQQVFNRLKNRFMRSLLYRQGTGFLGRLLPFGIGAVIGGMGNRKLGREVVKSAQKTLGPLPAWEQIPEVVHQLDSPETKEERKLRKAQEKELKKIAPSKQAKELESPESK